MTTEQKIEKLERFAATLTDLHLHYAEESRRYGEMVAECAAVKAEILARAEVSPEVARLMAESARPTPPAPAGQVEVIPELVARLKPGRLRRHTYTNVVRQVG